jgi:hypothetical protein
MGRLAPAGAAFVYRWPIRLTHQREETMRKMILMALAGFIWKKVQARMLKRAPVGTPRRPY